jgi:hypothetical protein
MQEMGRHPAVPTRLNCRMSATIADSIMPDNSAFAMRLARNIKGKVMFDRANRGRRWSRLG